MKFSCCRAFLAALPCLLSLLATAPAAAADTGVPPLRELGQLRGRVVDEESGAPIAGVRALVFPRTFPQAVGFAISGADGSFTIAGLEPGLYNLLIDGPGRCDQMVGREPGCTAIESADGLPVVHCDPTGSAEFQVSFGETADSGETRLPREGRLQGTIRLAEGRIGRPIVEIFSARHGYVGNSAATLDGNQWTFDVDVPGGGTYRLKASAAEHSSQLYDHLDCVTWREPYCLDYDLAALIAVEPGETQTAIDFDLFLDHRPCVASYLNLCLGDSRFSVHNYHTDASGNPDAWSRTAPITAEAGYFTFFDPNNVELVVKVLDACESYDAFWIFAAGLTDVNNRLVVRDNWAAETRTYTSTGPYRPLIDSTSFAACDLEPPAPEIGAHDAAPPAPAAASPAASHTPALVPNGCGSDPATSLCLGGSLGGRFKVEARWTTAGGQTGTGVPGQLTADTGFFHFFSPGNVEVVVKVLDACRPELGNTYWVFAAGMTDVAVTLEVTDTATGEQKVYLSPLGGLFQPILDLGAFATCGG